jgi:hypothetical protein
MSSREPDFQRRAATVRTGVTHHSPWPGPFTNVPYPPGVSRSGEEDEEYIAFAHARPREVTDDH